MHLRTAGVASTAAGKTGTTRGHELLQGRRLTEMPVLSPTRQRHRLPRVWNNGCSRSRGGRPRTGPHPRRRLVPSCSFGGCVVVSHCGSICISPAADEAEPFSLLAIGCRPSPSASEVSPLFLCSGFSGFVIITL